MLGSYVPGHNQMQTGNRELKFLMETEGRNHYQSVVWKDRELYRASIDLVIGSGLNLGQSYGTWQENRLLQLPISYYTPNKAWVNSPGFVDGTAVFIRPIISRCLECHVTAWDSATNDPMDYRRRSDKMIHGITCESCHGPGKDHVQHHRADPTDKVARKILAFSSTKASGVNALCSKCHGSEDPENEAPGVHSNNQLQRLQKSECFKKSGGLTCVDCHNPHRYERGKHVLAASRCQSCHELKDCKAVEPGRHQFFTEQCANCHMERRQMADIGFDAADREIIPSAIDHFIRVLPGKKTKIE